jgi:hypothetical protein
MTQSGTMVVTATADGYAVSDSAHVSVVPCLLSPDTLAADTLADDSRIRRKIAEAWNGSNVDGPPDQRVERYGGRYRRPDGSVVDTTFLTLPGATPCRSWGIGQWSPSTNTPGATLVHWHTHPFYPGPTSTDTLPSGCKNPNLRPRNRPQAAAAGPSGADMGQPGPFFVIDKKNLYFVDVAGNLKPAPRTQCDILRYY